MGLAGSANVRLVNAALLARLLRQPIATLVDFATCTHAMNAATSTDLSKRRRAWALPWPVPAVLAWAIAWAVWWLVRTLDAGPALALGLGLATGGALALVLPGCRGRWRRAIAAAGFPLSAFALEAAHAWPAWAWLALLLPLLVVYPLRAWRDAPFFPTPAQALQGLDTVVPAPTVVLDAGCGLGHGLRALHGLWPQAQLRGVEWSPLLAAAARLLCPWAQVRRVDMWADGWGQQDLVYVFQRPESMPRAWAKAQAEMAAGSWLVSLEFQVHGVAPHASLQRQGQRPVWIYRVPDAQPASQAAAQRGSTAAQHGR